VGTYAHFLILLAAVHSAVFLGFNPILLTAIKSERLFLFLAYLPCYLVFDPGSLEQKRIALAVNNSVLPDVIRRYRL
jgi:hypothetical protein